jgi:hypothetical protein
MRFEGRRIRRGDTVAIRTFGGTLNDPGLTCARCTTRALARGRDGATIWVGHFNRYQVEKWDTAGRHLLTLRRQANWFRPWGIDPDRRATAPQEPSLSEIQEDENGHLWLFFSRLVRGIPRQSLRSAGFGRNGSAGRTAPLAEALGVASATARALIIPDARPSIASIVDGAPARDWVEVDSVIATPSGLTFS